MATYKADPGAVDPNAGNATKNDGAPAEKPVPRFVAGKEPPKGKEVKLQYPIEYGDKVYESITCHRLTGKQAVKVRRAIQIQGLSEDEALMVEMTDAPLEVLEALDIEDYMALQEELQNFLPARLLQGED